MKGVILAREKRGVYLGLLLLGASLAFSPSEGKATQFLTGRIATVPNGSVQVVAANYTTVLESVSFEAFNSLGELFTSGTVSIVPQGFSTTVIDFGEVPPGDLMWMFDTGDCDLPFTIQSISKPFTYGLAIELFGHDKVQQ